jgi:MFS family permease
MPADETRTLRSNYIVNLLDGGFFGLTLGLASFSTILPLFVSTMTGSAFILGMIPAIQNIGWQLPQLMTANYTARMPRFKPAVMLITIHERLPYLALAILAWFLPAMDKRLALVLTFLILTWWALGTGLVANPWLNLIGKVFSGNILGTFLGFQSSALSLFGSFGAFLAGVILEANTGDQRGFFFCFLAAFLSSMVSYFMLNATVEAPRSDVPEIHQQTSILKNSIGILKANVPFRSFLIMKMISQFCLMAFSFYTVYAVRDLEVSDLAVGGLTSMYFFSQVVANPLLGFLSDRLGRRRAMEIGAVCGAASALCAFVSSSAAWMFPAMLLAGTANSAFSTIAMAYCLEFGNELNRPTYIGMSNTFIVPSTIVAPLLGGWLADQSGFHTTFLLAAVAGVMVFACIYFFVGKGQVMEVVN